MASRRVEAFKTTMWTLALFTVLLCCDFSLSEPLQRNVNSIRATDRFDENFLKTFNSSSASSPSYRNTHSFISRCNSNSSTCSNGTTMSKDERHRFHRALYRLANTGSRRIRVIVVDQNGNGDSKTVQGAVDMVPDNNVVWCKIIIRPGVYREKVIVPYTKPFITFQGSGSAETILTWNARAGDRGQGGQVLGTFGSASVAVESDYFVAKDITFENTAPPPLPGAQGMQAVALRVSGDRSAFIDCRMLGSQDTLFDHLGRHLFLRCYIEGAIDFVFGDGRSLYLKCELHANAATYGAIAASQRNSPSENSGFSFVECKLTGSGLLYLGRAWGQYARVVFALCYFENIIIPEGWYDWDDPFRRSTVFFGEYKCSGPGANQSGRAAWSKKLTYEEVRPFLGTGFINGHKWLHVVDL